MALDISEPYMTVENADSKTEEWSRLLEPYSRHPGPGLLNAAALLVVDMQKFFLEPESHAYVPSSPACLARLLPVLAAFRNAGKPVYMTRHFHRPGNKPGTMSRWWRHLLQENDPMSVLDAALEPGPYDLVLPKSTYSAFHGTGLASVLEERGCDKLVITGVMTHICVDTTARDAFVRNIVPVVVMDAVAAPDEELHLASLKSLAHGTARIATSKQVIDEIESEASGSGCLPDWSPEP